MTPVPDSLSWTAEGAPRSDRFDDVYFSVADGLRESRAVFLAGCGLPEAWRGRPHFTVGELGFGTGLNILALLDAWRSTRLAGQRLSIFSVEAYPMTAADAARALEAWPEVSDLAAQLLAQWPRRAPGFHRLDFPDLGATVDLAIGEAAWALDQWTGVADAWFLDGFSPAKNPQMWRDEVLEAVARRSAPGARLGTFTVAGAVRRGLDAAGFEVAKAPGYGRKRERLEGRRKGAPADARIPPPRRVAVVGAGVAGASLARAIRALGVEVTWIDAQGPGAGASGNPAALVSAALDAGSGPRARFYAQCLARAADLYNPLGEAAAGRPGLLQLERAPRDAARFDAVAASGVFDPIRLTRLDRDGASTRLGRPAAAGALWLQDGLTVQPRRVIEAWLGEGKRVTGAVARLERTCEGWRATGADGAVLAEADALCLAAGAGARALWPTLPLQPVRGQASWAAGPALDFAVAWGGYAAPMPDGVLFGATHDRDRADAGVDPLDHLRNLKTLAEALPDLAAALDPASLGGRASVRAATPDRMPLAGSLGPEGLFVLAGLGSRGFVTAPLLAEHVAALMTGAPSPLPAEARRLVDPGRFAA
ncbi:MAG TPA: FAD-dependent 5-carboxymethylaminomethyl-2-thiouridine(34) oxidoreductase MnmC [Caulobacteraceae bacterium]|nr:FAD-dependent 5-carboxymethylaminomethyl-2-thiouridine(34) oxidoreductase MnmC [Caulobacteraceae bacterium]